MKALLALVFIGSVALTCVALVDGVEAGPSLAGAKMIGAACCGALVIITLGVAAGGWRVLVPRRGESTWPPR